MGAGKRKAGNQLAHIYKAETVNAETYCSRRRMK
jgi:hypothetical protein